MSEESLDLRVYITATTLGTREVKAALSDGEGRDVEDFQALRLDGSTTQAVVRHHRRDNGGNHSTLFIVFDSVAFDKRGTLLVSLDEYHGFDDAVRYPPLEARYLTASLSIGNEDWYTIRQDLPSHKTDAAPMEWFALYNLLPSPNRQDFQSAIFVMNKGLQDVGLDNMADDGDLDELPRIYKAVETDSQDISQISDRHAAYAEDHDLDLGQFAVINDEYQTRGVLIVQAQPVKDSFFCRGLVAGELLRWIYIGFITWEEAREIASKQMA